MEMGRMRRPAVLLTLLFILLFGPLTARANDKITFGLDWKAEAEYGGYYQALATGLYEKAGLDVTIREGGPQVNHNALLMAGRLDFNITSDCFLALNFVAQNVPFKVVAAMFQKDPAVLIAHPGQGNDSFPALRGKPIMISSDTRAGWWNFLKAKFGFRDDQIRPYTFNLAPFLADPRAIQQGYLGSEPFSIKQATGEEPVVLLVADAGFQGYGSLIATSDKMIQQKPDLVQRFLDASIQGWYTYLNGNASPGNALILKENPEMTQTLIDYGRSAMSTNGILESGDAARLGIGAMTAERWAAFHKATAAEGLYPADMGVIKAYTLQFVNRKVGLPH
jgi:NitT/TauT family transport system substrate-binding protein